MLACCIFFGLVGSIAVIGIKTNRLRIAPPAKLLDLGPIWIGDFCRDNVAHHRYPPGWCPRDYTVYVILRFGARGSMHPVLTLPDTSPLPHTS
jgi:hypothetical protein